jgi:hypothetical protein
LEPARRRQREISTGNIGSPGQGVRHSLRWRQVAVFSDVFSDSQMRATFAHKGITGNRKSMPDGQQG